MTTGQARVTSPESLRRFQLAHLVHLHLVEDRTVWQEQRACLLDLVDFGDALAEVGCLLRTYRAWTLVLASCGLRRKILFGWLEVDEGTKLLPEVRVRSLRPSVRQG